jgi:hypothetical protein
MVSMLASGTQDLGLKILSIPSFGGEEEEHTLSGEK